MSVIGISEFRDARIVDVARFGSTMSGIASETGIPFASVRRTIYKFEDMGIIKTVKKGKKVFVRTNNPNHPIVKSMAEMTKWITAVIWNPDIFIARIFEKNDIDYAFVGTAKIKYTRKESRNMVQIAVRKEHYEKAKKIITRVFAGIGIKITEDPHEIIGNAMSVVYVKCFPVDKVKYEEYIVKTTDSNEIIKVRIADDDTEKESMQDATREDVMFIPAR